TRSTRDWSSDVCSSDLCRRVEIAIARQDMVDLEEVVRRDAETLDQRTLDRLRYFRETDLIILAFQHVDLCERHVGLLLKCRAGRSEERRVGTERVSRGW